MRISTRDIIKKLVTIIMIGLFGMLITNKAIFMHVHKLEDGSIVAHSHPYNESDNKTPYKTHHHSKTELLLIQSLELLFYFILVAVFFHAGIKQFKAISKFKNVYSNWFFNLFQERAPPPFFYI